MPDEAPVLPQVEDKCRDLLMLRTDELSAMQLMGHALSLDMLCQRAQLELCTGSKFALARLILEAATHLQPLVFNNTAKLLGQLVGKAGIEDLLRPLLRDGWVMVDCGCGQDACPGYIIMTKELKETGDNIVEQIVNMTVDGIVEAIVRCRRPPAEYN